MATKLTAFVLDHDGDRLRGQLGVPAGPGPHPAVLIIHDARGIGGVALERAHRLVEMGYAALAADMYGGGVYSENASECASWMQSLVEAPLRLRARVAAFVAALRDRPDIDTRRIAAIGFCFGGLCVLEYARSGADVKSVVSYHGILDTRLPARPDQIKARVSVFTGAKDPYVPDEHVSAFRSEMLAAHASWDLTIYSDALHAFTDPNAGLMKDVPGVGYNSLADKLSWASTTALFDTLLRNPETSHRP